jgi:DNA-binding response OmpR family regulator
MTATMPQRVLIVEDEQHLAEGLRFNLEAEGFEAEVLDNGARALERLLDPAAHFDLVVLDVMLPGKDGFAVARELRQRQVFVPILMLTARGRPEDVLSGFAAGADDYLAKPAELAILLARIGGCCAAAPGRTSDRPKRSARNRSTIGSRLTVKPLTSTPWN